MARRRRPSRLAYTAERSRRFEDILRFSPSAVDSDPRDADARHSLARALVWVHGRDSKELDRVQLDVNEALRLRPDHVDPILSLSQALVAGEIPDVAAGFLMGFLKIRPHVEEAHNNLGLIVAEQGGMKRAMERYRAAL